MMEANQGVDPKTGRAWAISPTTGQKHWGDVPKDPRMGSLKKNPSAGSNPQSGDIGPLEYKLASAITRVYESHELAMGKQSHAGPTWPQEVDRAAGDLEDALIDAGALNELLKLIDAISSKLHNGEYAPANAGMRSGPGGGPMWDD